MKRWLFPAIIVALALAGHQMPFVMASRKLNVCYLHSYEKFSSWNSLK